MPPRRKGLRFPPLRLPPSPPIRPAFTDDTPAPPDWEFERARALYDEFQPEQGERSLVSSKWGDVRAGADVNTNRGAFEIPWIDIGPFPEPVELDINMFIDPDPRNVTSGGLGPWIPEMQWKAIQGIGTGKVEKRTAVIQPRSLICQSLTLFASDVNNLCADPYRVAIYASRRRAGGLPRAIGFSQYLMGIGTTLVQMDWPPREATHFMVGRGSLSNISMTVRLGSGFGPIQELTVMSGSGTVGAFNPIIPIIPDATTWSLQRSSGTASDTYTVWWLR